MAGRDSLLLTLLVRESFVQTIETCASKYMKAEENATGSIPYKVSVHLSWYSGCGLGGGGYWCALID